MLRRWKDRGEGGRGGTGARSKEEDQVRDGKEAGQVKKQRKPRTGRGEEAHLERNRGGESRRRGSESGASDNLGDGGHD